MSAAAQHPFKQRTERLSQSVLSLAMGLSFTLCLFYGIAHFEKAAPETPPPEIEDLRLVAIPIQPPPPPTQQSREVQPDSAPMPLTGFELSPSDSPIKIAVSPPELDFLMPPPQAAPPANIPMGSLETNFKPSIELTFNANHVFQHHEVDRVPAVLYREVPPVPSRIRGSASELRVVFLIIVDANGAVYSIRELKSSGNPEFDALLAECVKYKWAFSPAIRKGKKVRCLLQQCITIKWPATSRFEA